ncbi:MAG: hypothetical protein J0H74_33800 [Chitinophagaceae bacterium]|nr:hypothetical protein [Chitinophagaceae bacterium]
MDLDDFKEDWSKDTIIYSRPLKSLQPINGTSSIVYRIRKHIRNDFLKMTLFYLLLLLIFILRSQTALSLFLISLITFLLLVQGALYFWRFFLFYKKLLRYDLSLRKSLRRIAYELEINIELYRNMVYCAVPLTSLVLIGLIGENSILTFFRQLVLFPSPLTITGLLPPFLWVLILQIIIYQLLKWHIRIHYTRYLNALNQILEDIDREA